jgi:hypothetical protein
MAVYWSKIDNPDSTLSRDATTIDPDPGNPDVAVVILCVEPAGKGWFTAWVDRNDGKLPVQPGRYFENTEAAQTWCLDQVRDLLSNEG